MLQLAEMHSRNGRLSIYRFWELKIEKEENNKFSINIYIHNTDGIADRISFPLSNEKLYEIISISPINRGRISKYITFLEDTETGKIEPYFSDSKEVKAVLKRDLLLEEELNIGDQVEIFDGFFYNFYYMGNIIIDGKLHSKIIGLNNINIENPFISKTIVKKFNDIKIVRKGIGRLSPEEIAVYNNL